MIERRFRGQLVRTQNGFVTKIVITPKERRNIPKEILMFAVTFLAFLAALLIFAIL